MWPSEAEVVDLNHGEVSPTNRALSVWEGRYLGRMPVPRGITSYIIQQFLQNKNRSFRPVGAVKARVNTGFASEGQLFSVYSAKQDLGCCGGRAKNYVQPVI